MIFKIFQPFLADPLTLIFLITEYEQTVHNAEKFFMFFIDDIHSDIKPILPYELITHDVLLCHSAVLSL